MRDGPAISRPSISCYNAILEPVLSRKITQTTKSMRKRNTNQAKAHE